MPARRQQARWPKGTPGGLGGQFRPEGLDLGSRAANILTGVAALVQDASGDKSIVRELNRAAGKVNWEGGNTDRDVDLMTRAVHANVLSKVSHGTIGAMAGRAPSVVSGKRLSSEAAVIDKAEEVGSTLPVAAGEDDHRAHVADAIRRPLESPQERDEVAADLADQLRQTFGQMQARDSADVKAGPAHSASGRLRNFRAMSDAKLDEVAAQHERYTRENGLDDPKADAKLNEVAEERGRPWRIDRTDGHDDVGPDAQNQAAIADAVREAQAGERFDQSMRRAQESAGKPESPARSGSGRVRNLKAMKDEKLAELADDMRGYTEADGEASDKIMNELTRRLNGRTTVNAEAMRGARARLHAAIAEGQSRSAPLAPGGRRDEEPPDRWEDGAGDIEYDYYPHVEAAAQAGVHVQSHPTEGFRLVDTHGNVLRGNIRSDHELPLLLDTEVNKVRRANEERNSQSLRDARAGVSPDAKRALAASIRQENARRDAAQAAREERQARHARVAARSDRADRIAQAVSGRRAEAPAPAGTHDQSKSAQLAAEVVGRLPEPRQRALQVVDSPNGRYARVQRKMPGRRKPVTVAYVKHSPQGGHQISYTKGSEGELAATTSRMTETRDAIGVRGIHRQFGNDQKERAALGLARAMDGAAAASLPSTSAPAPSAQKRPDYPGSRGARYGSTFTSPEGLAQHLVDVADSRLPGDETSGYTVEAPPSGNYARIVHPQAGTVAYVKHNADGLNVHRITFTRGHDETIDKVGRHSTGQAASVRNGKTRRLRTPIDPERQIVTEANDAHPDGKSTGPAELSDAADALLAVREEPRRRAAGEPRPSRGAKTAKAPRGLMPGVATRVRDDGRQFVPKPSGGVEGRSFGVENEIAFSPADAKRALTSAGLRAGTPHGYGSAGDLTVFDLSRDPTAPGVEVATPPLVGKDGIDLLRKMQDSLYEAGGRQGPQRSHGLHVHVNVTDLTREQRERLQRSYKNNSKVIDQLVSPNRRSNGWAGGPSASVGPGHRQALNTSMSHGTYEFRRLGSNMSADQVSAWVEMLLHFVEWHKTHDGQRDEHVIGAQPTLEAFMEELGIPEDLRARLRSRAEAVANGRRR